MEKFITANTQELAKDKWLCPLSGKKFKGPEFVRKHIQSKHTEKIDEVRTEVRTHVPHSYGLVTNTRVVKLQRNIIFKMLKACLDIIARRDDN